MESGILKAVLLLAPSCFQTTRRKPRSLLPFLASINVTHLMSFVWLKWKTDVAYTSAFEKYQYLICSSIIIKSVPIRKYFWMFHNSNKFLFVVHPDYFMATSTYNLLQKCICLLPSPKLHDYPIILKLCSQNFRESHFFPTCHKILSFSKYQSTDFLRYRFIFIPASCMILI